MLGTHQRWIALGALAVFLLAGVGAAQTIPLELRTAESGEVYRFTDASAISRLTVSGTVAFDQPNNMVRIILIREDGHEYLVYESFPLMAEEDHFTISNVCEETCTLDGIVPVAVRVDLVDTELSIDAITVLPAAARAAEINGLTEEALPSIAEIRSDKIRRLNEQIRKRGLKWIAGETAVSRLSFEEKKKLFGGRVPNLQGFEYYVGGIFEILPSDPQSSLVQPAPSTLIDHFDWRQRHGADDPSSPYYDGDASGSGWITSVKHQLSCGSCWAFAATGATEALANIYFNDHIDLDLSEQDALSCSGAGNCIGGWPGLTLDYYTSVGVVDEACFPYTAREDPCDKCTDPAEIIRINGRIAFDEPKTEEKLKQMIVDHGPLSGGIFSWIHAMVLVGYDKDSDDGRTVWIF